MTSTARQFTKYHRSNWNVLIRTYTLRAPRLPQSAKKKHCAHGHTRTSTHKHSLTTTGSHTHTLTYKHTHRKNHAMHATHTQRGRVNRTYTHAHRSSIQRQRQGQRTTRGRMSNDSDQYTIVTTVMRTKMLCVLSSGESET